MDKSLQEKIGVGFDMRFWPMRKALTHLVTLNKMEGLLKPEEYEKIDETQLARVVDVIEDGTNLPRAKIETLGWPQLFPLIAAIRDNNVTPR